MMKRFLIASLSVIAASAAVVIYAFERGLRGVVSKSDPVAYCVRYKYRENDGFRSLSLYGVREKRGGEHRFAVFVDEESFTEDVRHFEEDLSRGRGDGDALSTFVSGRLSGRVKVTIVDAVGDGSVKPEEFVVTIIGLYEAIK